MDKAKRLTVLSQHWANCTQCMLCNSRQSVVFGYGNPDAQLMIVGEAPGANEDREGLPFVGNSGMVLDNLIAATSVHPEIMDMCEKNNFDFRRIREILLNEIYYTNVVACRPPENRDPTPKEAEACWPRLRGIIYTVDPALIVASGRIAAESLLGRKVQITNQRGEMFDLEFEGNAVTYRYPVLAILHPSYLLRQNDWNNEDGAGKKTYKDMLKAMRIIDELNRRHYGVPPPANRPRLD